MRLTPLCLAAALTVSAGALAQDYPNKAVQVINQFNPGAVVDVLARVAADEMGQVLGKPFIAVNREGAGGLVAGQAIANARPDGYTIGFMTQGPLIIQPYLQKTQPYSLDSFVPVCHLFENHFAILVAQNAPYKTLDDMVTFARANPGKLSWGVFGVASVPHLQFYSLLRELKLEMTSIPYKSMGQMSQDVAAGHLDIGVTAFGSFNAFAVRPVAVLSDRRNPTFPDIPTVHEQGYAVSMPAFGGFVVPKGTPAEIVKALGDACTKVAESDRYKEISQRTGSPLIYMNGEKFAERLRADRQFKAELIKALNIEPQ